MDNSAVFTDFTDFNNMWFTTPGGHFVEPPIDGHLFIPLRVDESGIEIRKVFKTPFKQSQIKVSLRICLPIGLDVTTFDVKAFMQAGEPGHFPLPPSDGKWHNVCATFTPTTSESNQLWINLRTNPVTTEEYVKVDNILIEQQ